MSARTPRREGRCHEMDDLNIEEITFEELPITEDIWSW